MSQENNEETWKEEFEVAYEVPEVILALVEEGLLADTSWHKDTSPSFGIELANGDQLRLWVEHPDPKQRMIGAETQRFMLMIYPVDTDSITVYETDDADDAVSFLRNYLGALNSDRRRRPLIQIRLSSLSKRHVLMSRLEKREFVEVRPSFLRRSVLLDTELGVVVVDQIKYQCIGCEKPWPESYMVKNEVWEAAGFGRGHACLACLRKRLGRPLVLEDFQEGVGCNELIFEFAKSL